MKSLTNRICKAILHYEENTEIVKSITGWNWIKEGINVGLKENWYNIPNHESVDKYYREKGEV